MRSQSGFSDGKWALVRPFGARASESICILVAGLLLTIVLSSCSENGSVEEGDRETGARSAASSGSTADRLDDATLLGILQHPDMLMRVEKIAAHLQTLEPAELAETRRVFESASFDRGDLEYTLFGEWWARFDAPAAQRWADITMKARHPRVIASIVRAWAKQDPEAAVASGRFSKVQAGAPIYRADLLDALVVGWFDSGKSGVEGFLQSLGGEDQARGLRTYARVRSIREGLQETLEWARRADGFTEPEQRLLTAGVLEVVAGQDPKLAAEYLEIAKADGVDTRTFVARVAGGWAEFDHQGALEWLETVEDGPDRNRGIARVAGVWVKEDQASLEAYLTENEGKGWLDQVRVLVARRTVNLSKFRPDWNAVMQGISGIVEDKKRWSTRAWVLQRWFAVDEAAAGAYLLGDSDLPEGFRGRAREISQAVRAEVESALDGSSPLRAD